MGWSARGLRMAKARQQLAPTVATTGKRTALVMPAELTFNRPEYGWPSQHAFRKAQARWMREHGVDPDDWLAAGPVLVASRRAHARRVGELDVRARMAWLAAQGPNASYDGLLPPPPAA
jgi:hypothetical protein